MADGREPYRRGLGHGRLHPYDGPTSPRDQFYGGPLRENRDAFRRPSYDRGFTSPLGRAGNFNGPEGPVSPDRDRPRGYSPDRRPYSPPDHDRRAYSPDRIVDRDRGPRYQLQERTNGYRPRDEGFRRETYGYRGDDSRPPVRSRDPSPDHHHGHYHGGRDQLQPIRDRGADVDPHPRPASREGTPLDGWGMERGGKMPLIQSIQSHGLGVSRGPHRGGSSAPSSSGSLRGAAADYVDNGPSSNGDLEAGEVAPGPGAGPGSRSDHHPRPSPEQHHNHHHSSHHHHHHSSYHHGHHGHSHGGHVGHGPGPGSGPVVASGPHHNHHPPHRSASSALLPARGNGPGGAWEAKSTHPGTGLGSGPGPAGHRDGPPPPPPRDSGRDAGREAGGRSDLGRDVGRENSRDLRDGPKSGYRSGLLPSGLPPYTGRDGPSRSEAGAGKDGPPSARDRDKDRDRERDREKAPHGSSAHPARSLSQGGPPLSPGQSPRRAGSDTAAQAPAMGNGGDTPRAGDRGADASGEQRRLSGSGGSHHHHHADRRASSGAAAGAAVPAAMEVERRSSSTAMDLDRRQSSGTVGTVYLDRRASGSSSHGQLPAPDVAPPPGRSSTAGTAPMAIESTPPASLPLEPPGVDGTPGKAAGTRGGAEPLDVLAAAQTGQADPVVAPVAPVPSSAVPAPALADPEPGELLSDMEADPVPANAPAAVPVPSERPLALDSASVPSICNPSEVKVVATAVAESTAALVAAPPAASSAPAGGAVDAGNGQPTERKEAAGQAARAALNAAATAASPAASPAPTSTTTPAAAAAIAAAQPPVAPVPTERPPPATGQLGTIGMRTAQAETSATTAAATIRAPSSGGVVSTSDGAPGATAAAGDTGHVAAGSASGAAGGTGAASAGGASSPAAGGAGAGAGDATVAPATNGANAMPAGTGTTGVAASAGGACSAGGAAAGGDDAMAPERRSSLSIRRFGFGRARRSLPAKSAGETVPEEGELPATSIASPLERTPSGTVRMAQPGQEAMEGEAAAAGVPPAAPAGHQEPLGGSIGAGPSREPLAAVTIATFPPAISIAEPAGAPPSLGAGVPLPHLIALPTPVITPTPVLTPGMPPSASVTPLAASTPGAAMTPGGAYLAAGAYTPQCGPGAMPLQSPLGAAAAPGSAPAAWVPMTVGLGATRSASSAPSGSSPSGAAAGCLPMEVDSHQQPPLSQDGVAHVHNYPQQPQQQQPAADGAGASSSNPAETVAGISLRIEHLETEITDLERKLAALASEARQAHAEASELDAKVGALEEQLLEDSSEDDDDVHDESEAEGGAAAGGSDHQCVEPEPDGPVDRSGGSTTSASGGAPAANAAATGAVPADAGAAAAGDDQLGEATRDMEIDEVTETGVNEGAEEEADDAAVAARSHDAEDAATAAMAAAPSIKPRGRPRSTAKMRAAEAAAAAAAAADSRRKALEQQARVPPDGMLHLPAAKFKPRMLEATRRAVVAGREEVLRLLPDDLVDRVQAAIDAAAAQQARLAGSAPAPGSGRWAIVAPLVPVRVEPMYREPQDIPAFHANVQRHANVRDAVCRYLRQRRQLVAAKQEVLVAQYARNMASYKQYVQMEGRRPPAPTPPIVIGRGTGGGASSYGMYHSSSRGAAAFNPYAYSHSDVIRSDLDEQRLLNNFAAVEQLKHMCALPDMVLDPWERRWRAYDNRNGLVQDPVRELEEERIIKAWAEEERTLFMDKFLQHPKDFRKISTYLPGRSPGDCVAFFYKNQKLDDFATVRRKQQLKKRRLQADMRKQQYAPLLMAPMIARQRAMGPAGAAAAADAGGVRGVRGRASTRTGPGRGRSGNLLDPDNALGGVSHMGYAGGAGSLPMSIGAVRAMPSGLPSFASMMAHRSTLVCGGGGGGGGALDPREAMPAPLLPPISSSVAAAAVAAAAAAAAAAAQAQQQQPPAAAAAVAPSGPVVAGWTDEDFVDCYRQHGRCWEAFCRVLGMKTESAAKQYYYRHRERLGLDRLGMVGSGAAAAGAGGGLAALDGSGVTAIATASAAGPGRKAYLAARLASDESLVAAAAAAAAQQQQQQQQPSQTASAILAAAASAAAPAAGPPPPLAVLPSVGSLGAASVAQQQAPAKLEVPPRPGSGEASPALPDDLPAPSVAAAAAAARDAELQLLQALPAAQQQATQAAAAPPPPLLQSQGQMQAQAQAQALLEMQPGQALTEAKPHPQVLLIPKGTGGRRRGPPRVPASTASMSNGPHSSAASLESSEVLRHDGRYKQELDADMRSDSEYDPTNGGSGGSGAVGAADGLPTAQMDLLTALRIPTGSTLTQLLAGGLLQGAGGVGAGGSKAAKGGSGAAGGAAAVGGGGGKLEGVLGHLLMQQQQREQQQQQAGGLGALGMGLNLGLLGGLGGVLQGGVGGPGAPGGGATISLFTGPSGGSQFDDPSTQFSPGDDGPVGPGPIGGATGMGRKGANYWNDDEKSTFLRIFQKHGRDWARLADAIPTKSTSQIKTFYHNYKTKLGLDRIELPPTAAQPVGRRGQVRAVREAAAAAAAAAAAMAGGGGSRGGLDEPNADDERPAKRPATGHGPSQSSGLELGGVLGSAGDVSPQRGGDGSGGATSPVLPPVMDLQALASVYGAGAQQQSQQHHSQLFLRGGERELQGQGGAGGGAAPTAASLLQVLSCLSELHGGPSSGGPGQLLAGREAEEALSLGRGSLSNLSAMQLQALHLPASLVGGGGGNSAAVNLFTTATSSAQQQQQQQQQQSQAPPIKLQALNLDAGSLNSLFGAPERDRDRGGERDRDRDRDRERDRERDRDRENRASGTASQLGSLAAFTLGSGGAGGGAGGLMLQDAGLSHSLLAQQLQLQALTSSMGERDRGGEGRGGQLREREQQQRGGGGGGGGGGLETLSSEALTATILELLAGQAQQQQQQHPYAGAQGAGGGAGGLGQVAAQALDLAAPSQASALPLDMSSNSVPSTGSASNLIAAIVDAVGAGGGPGGGSEVGGGSRVARPSSDARAALGGNGGNPGLSLQVVIPRELRSERERGLEALRGAVSSETRQSLDGGLEDQMTAVEPAAKRQKRLSRETQSQQQPQQPAGLDLGIPPSSMSGAVSPSRGDGGGASAAGGGSGGRLQLGEDTVTQQLLLQLQQQHQAANSLAGGALRQAVAYDLLREPRQQKQQQQHRSSSGTQPQAQALNLGPLAGLQVLAGCGGGGAGAAPQSVLRLVPLQSAAASVQQQQQSQQQHQQQQQQQSQQHEGGGGGIARLQLGGALPLPLGQGQAVSVADVLSLQLQGGRGLVLQAAGGSQGAGGFGIGGGLDRLLVSGSDAVLGSAAGQYISLQPGTRGGASAGGWLGAAFGDQVAAGLGQRATLSLNQLGLLLQQQQQQQQQGNDK